MFPLPTKDQGRLIAVSRIRIVGDQFREAGQEVPEAFEWRNLQDLLKVGKLRFKPKETQDPALPGQALAFLNDQQLRDLCEIRKVDNKGTKPELIDRLLDAAGYRHLAPKDTSYQPRPYEASRGSPTIPQIEQQGAIRQPSAPIVEKNSEAEIVATIAKLDKMNVSELERLAKLHNVSTVGRTRDDLIGAITGAMHTAPTTPSKKEPAVVSRPATENPKAGAKKTGG